MAASNRVVQSTCGAMLVAFAFIVVPQVAHATDNQYFDRMDKITTGAGNAVAHNIAVQTINPWPRYVRNDRINVDGRRIALAHRRYQSNRSLPPRGLSTSGVVFSASAPQGGGGTDQNDAGGGAGAGAGGGAGGDAGGAAAGVAPAGGN